MKNEFDEKFRRIGNQWADPMMYGRLKEYAAKMRSVPTHAENLLWQALRGKKLDGHKFGRQHIISRYIADFTCLRQRLIIEIDGLIHQLPENLQSDKEREEALVARGFSVMRFTNKQVETQLNYVLNAISSVLEKKM